MLPHIILMRVTQTYVFARSIARRTLRNNMQKKHPDISRLAFYFDMPELRLLQQH